MPRFLSIWVTLAFELYKEFPQLTYLEGMPTLLYARWVILYDPFVVLQAGRLPLCVFIHAIEDM